MVKEEVKILDKALELFEGGKYWIKGTLFRLKEGKEIPYYLFESNGNQILSERIWLENNKEECVAGFCLWGAISVADIVLNGHSGGAEKLLFELDRLAKLKGFRSAIDLNDNSTTTWETIEEIMKEARKEIV